jgi:hypothetical protein
LTRILFGSGDNLEEAPQKERPDSDENKPINDSRSRRNEFVGQGQVFEGLVGHDNRLPKQEHRHRTDPKKEPQREEDVVTFA